MLRRPTCAIYVALQVTSRKDTVLLSRLGLISLLSVLQSYNGTVPVPNVVTQRSCANSSSAATGLCFGRVSTGPRLKAFGQLFADLRTCLKRRALAIQTVSSCTGLHKETRLNLFGQITCATRQRPGAAGYGARLCTSIVSQLPPSKKRKNAANLSLPEKQQVQMASLPMLCETYQRLVC